MNLHSFGLFMIGAMALNLTPGPDMTFIMAQSAARGTRAGIAAALGVGLGCLVHVVLAVLGLAAILALHPVIFTIVKYAGALYLFWIAIGMVRHPPQLSGEARVARDVRRAFRQGILTCATNPKVALFFVAFLPQFVTPGGLPAWQQFLILGLAFNLSGNCVDCCVALGSGQLAARLRRNPRIGRLIGWFSASVMASLAVRLLWSNPQGGAPDI